jgi:nucleoside-diphosphate-sugar epimerase
MRKFLTGKFRTILNKGEERGNYAYVDDVVDGHIRALSVGQVGQKYILGGDNCSLNRFFAILCELSGRKPPRFHVPPALARWIGTADEIRARVTGSYPLISRGWIETFLRNWAYSSDKASTELGYDFRGIEEGLQLTYRWLLKERMVKPYEQ